MKTQAHNQRAECAGRWLAGAWKGIMRQEKRLAVLLMACGLPAAGVRAALSLVKVAAVIIVVVAVLSSATLAALFVAGAVVFALASNADLELKPHEDEPRLRDGYSGYGTYRNGQRIDMHDPTDEQ